MLWKASVRKHNGEAEAGANGRVVRVLLPPGLLVAPERRRVRRAGRGPPRGARPVTREGCPACAHMDARTIDRFLVLPAGAPGKRGPRSLARDFGLDRRHIAAHEKFC